MPKSSQLMEIINVQTDIAKLGLDLGGVMAIVVERTLALVGADGAAIELAEGGDMVYRATAGIATPFLGLRLKIGSSLSGLCVRTGETIRSNDSESDPRVDREACRKVGLRSMIVMPLKHGNATVGVLKAMAVEPNKFSDADMELLRLLSELIAAAMFYATKYDNIDALFFKATHDGLTGLANRSMFMDRLRQCIAHYERDRHPIAVLMIDMDGLKSINDNFGHRAGDEVIIEFSKRILAGARATDTIARLGGDEFGAILTPIELPSGIESAISRMTTEIERPFAYECKDFDLRASIGAALFPKDSQEIGPLIEMADSRMYQVKREHKALR